MGMGYFCDGKVSFVVGIYIYVFMGDVQVLLNGMVFLLDVGMCGDYDSVIGMNKVEFLCCFVIGMFKGCFELVMGDVILLGVYVEIDDCNGKVKCIEMVWQGGRL